MGLIPIYAWTKGFRNFEQRNKRFQKQPWAQGVILLACVVIAMLLANLPFTKHFYHDLLHTSISIGVQSPSGFGFHFPMDMTVEKLINDVIMVVFFFVVGLEIRHEMAYGELSSPKKALMPIIAACGGVLVPALIFAFVNKGTAAASGWGIPTATDIAFAIGILSILGNKVPVSLKVFLTALAIVDDLIAILVVAIFYGGSINLVLLGIAIAVILVTLFIREVGDKHPAFFFAMSVIVWILFYYAGIHATMAGVVMAFLVPIKARYTKAYYYHKRDNLRRRLEEYEAIPDACGFPNGPQRHILRRLSKTSNDCIPMTYRLEHAWSPWVNFLIMPIFALANAGVEIPDLSYFNVFKFDPALGGVSMGVFLGLVLGKPIGITLASFIAVKAKFGAMPDKANWKMLFAVACLGGIGFTMSIFVDTLSFGDQTPEIMGQLRNMGKVAVLLASLTAGIVGSILINIFSKFGKKSNEAEA